MAGNCDKKTPKNKASLCCCGKCGDKLSGSQTCCCTFTCHGICAVLEGGCEDDYEGPNACSCLEPAFTYLEFNTTSQTYVGELNCGDVSIDVEFSVRWCPDTQECMLCLNSDCLSASYGQLFDAACDNATSCYPIGASTINCIGEMQDDWTLLGGIEHIWEVDVRGCGDPNCTAYQIRTKCVGRIHPKPMTALENECGCEGCFCMCQEMCISYRGHNTCEDGARVPYDSLRGGWAMEVTECDEADPDQQGRAIEIILEKNQYTGGCQLRVTTPEVVDEMGTEETKVTIVDLTSCPDVPTTRIYVDTVQEDYFEFTCWKCGLCPDELICTCKCNAGTGDTRGYVVPRTLTLDWSGSTLIGTPSGDVTISDSGSVTLVRDREACLWLGYVRIYCVDEEYNTHLTVYTFQLEPGEDPGRFGDCPWFMQVFIDGFGPDAEPAPTPPECETNPILDLIGTWSEGGGSWDTVCECDPLSLSYAATPSEVSSISILITE